MKVQIDRDQDGWHYGEPNENGDTMSSYSKPDLLATGIPSYPQAKRHAEAAGFEVDNAGWKHKLVSWNWHSHSFDKYPEWEIEEDDVPAFVKLTHTRVDGAEVESYALAQNWDDIAEVDFYQRDWTDSGLPFVDDGETYWSGWWFATIAERDRFVLWAAARRV